MTPDPVASLLARFPFMVLDGALGTELQARGCSLDAPLWSARVLIEQPKLIRQVHDDYFIAGADCATTASYQASVAGFTHLGLSENEALALIARSVEIARASRDAYWSAHATESRPRPLVAASIGPYGAFLADGSEYRGYPDMAEEALIGFHRSRIGALAVAGPDLLACETLPSLVEAKALVRLLTEFPSLGAWFSFSARDEAHISDGTPVAECARWLDAQPQVLAIGVNCTAPRFIDGLIHEMAKETHKPIVVYPNSGEVYDPVSRQWRGTCDADSHSRQAHAKAFAQLAQGWLTSGARLIGGCCRTRPDDIRALARLRLRLATSAREKPAGTRTAQQ